MSMILLAVEDAERDAPIRELLTREGWWVTTVGKKEEALRAAADHAPQLVILDRGMEDPAGLLKVFSRQSGGCGVLVLIDRLAEESAGFTGDGVVARDQPGETLVAKVRRSLDAPRAAKEAPTAEEAAEEREGQFTARDIFGDILEHLGESGGATGDAAGVAEPAEEVERDAAAETPKASRPEAAAETPGAEADSAEVAPDEPPPVEVPPEEDPVPPDIDSAAGPMAEPEIESQTDEPTTDLVEEVADLLDSDDEEWTGPDTDSGVGLMIDEVLAIDEQEDAEEVAEDDTAEQETEDSTEPPAEEEATAEASDDGLERVGGYELLELADHGDLTERWFARRVDGDGERLLFERVRFELRNRADVRDAFVEGNSDAAGWEHRNVLPVIDLRREAELDFVVTEYRPGHSLAEVLDRVSRMEGRMPLGISLLVVEQLAAALAVLDEGPSGARHGWLVPSSVWLTEDGEVLLREFGVGRLATLDDSLVRDWADHRFIAPEKWGGPGDIRSDLYSLGALFYEMVTGRPVHRAEDYEALGEAIQAGPRVRAQEADPTIPAEVDSWVMRLLRSDPSDRPQSVSEVMAKIDLALQALPVRPSNAELNAYVRQLFAARVPDTPVAVDAGEPEAEAGLEEVTSGDAKSPWWGGLTWWWLLIPLLALLSMFVGWKLMAGGEPVTQGGPGAGRDPVLLASAEVLEAPTPAPDSTPIRTLQ